ncbi:RNA-binding family protein isoform 1 [Hibiscus syriacus]|uniref:RNA-binding family protein isoform 1 n=1 Tax=Hibiscus syriacus TaxID=106335 RepID=A0A6A2ZNS2_HIBSY|nr:alpha-1,3-arabinosyltransferase XAT3-like [Hibiscus syriacus]KAE8692545.1 RNA-binding family protein isoform 1 [Hibiscus syriacus]
MVHHHRYAYQLKKDGDEEEGTLVLVWTNPGYYKRRRTKLFSFLLLSLLSCTFILAPHLFSFSTPFSHLYSFGVQNEGLAGNLDVNAPICSSISNGTICCDRSHFRSDVCFMKGDIRTHSPTSSVYLYSSRADADEGEDDELQHEKIKPYTRKWETSVMDTIDELDLISKRRNSGVRHRCDVIHDVPAVIFSTGGYTGNVYHEFNDGIIPLYITSQQFNRKVVFVILEYHNWWVMKYGDILSHLSNYAPIDFNRDNRTHCFTEAITGLRIHDELTVDPSLMKKNKSIVDFRHLLDRAYRPRIEGLTHGGVEDAQEKMQPKLVILSRNGSRAITNEKALVKTAEEIGFLVRVLRPQPTTELAKIYKELNLSDAMIGVHGAAMTHLLFMRPDCSVFIQVIPLGTDWAAETYYGEPAKKLGLKYIGYKIIPKESSLSDEYDEDDPVLKDPSSLNRKGWEYTKKIYLERQTVKLDMQRFRKRLVRAYDHIISRKTQLRSHSIRQLRFDYIT